MSLPRLCTQSPLFATVTADFFAPDDRYRLFAGKIFPLVLRTRPALEGAYSTKGRAGLEPALLAGVTVLQFLEGVPDRQAAEMLRYHLGWNFALNRTIGQRVFHPTSLVYFRARMAEKNLEGVVFAQVLEGLVEAGLVERRGKQRLDSTQMVGLVARMSRLECMRETLRLALKELESRAASLDLPTWWPLLWERYVSTKLDYRAQTTVLKEKMDQAGADAVMVLEWVARLSDPAMAQGSQIRLLKRVLEENFQCDPGKAAVQRPAQPTGAVHNPHEPQAQWASKGMGKHKKEHVGYKVQVAESVVIQPLGPQEPTRAFVTGIATQPASASDEAGAEQMEQEQAAMGLDKPTELYVDGAYISGEKLAQAQGQGRQLIGPAQAPPQRDGRFSSQDFQVDVEQRQAVCPAGKPSAQCSRLEEQGDKVNYRFEWTYHCTSCPLRSQCVGKDQPHRTLLVGQYHSPLQARRREQKTEEFKKKTRHRNAIEGTHSELKRAHGLGQARYRGLARVRLQNYFIGAACNAKRWIRRAIWEMRRAGMGAGLSPSPAGA
jgi:hypothetical protein